MKAHIITHSEFSSSISNTYLHTIYILKNLYDTYCNYCTIYNEENESPEEMTMPVALQIQLPSSSSACTHIREDKKQLNDSCNCRAH